MWPTNLRSSEAMEAGLFPSGPYPEHEGEPDCTFYLRTGLCRFGFSCRFNHPPNRNLAIPSARMKGDYPERLGQLECQYYLKTGNCKYGATCKFHHPKDEVGIATKVSVNTLGYPLRPVLTGSYFSIGKIDLNITTSGSLGWYATGVTTLTFLLKCIDLHRNVSSTLLLKCYGPHRKCELKNEQECAHYLRTGQCKFGSTCKFHHPQSTNLTSFRGSVIYPLVQSPTTPAHQSFQGGMTNWPLSTPIMPRPQWQAPSSYSPLILPQGVVSVPGWNAYMARSGSVPSSVTQQQIGGSTPIYGTSTSPGIYPGYRSGSVRTGYYALQRNNVFPERPGQPECQYYMKTGDCKFGTVCKFNHPKERLIPAPDCPLSPIGLPLRPGEPLCTFYTRHGICKFGPNCKFDHTFKFAYNVSASASADTPVVRHYSGSSSPPAEITLPAEVDSANTKRLSLVETREIAPVDDDVETEG